MVERLVMLGKSDTLLRECFTSLMEASARINQVEGDTDEHEEDMDDEDDDDGEIEDDDDDEVS